MYLFLFFLKYLSVKLTPKFIKYADNLLRARSKNYRLTLKFTFGLNFQEEWEKFTFFFSQLKSETVGRSWLETSLIRF